MMDLEAIQQAINARNKLIEYRQKIISKQKSDEQELGKLMSGKTTFKTLFKSKSGKEGSATILRKAIELEGEDIAAYQKIINIINQHLFEKSIPWFKQDKMANYFSMLDLLWSQEMSNSNVSLSYWNMVQGQVAYSKY